MDTGIIRIPSRYSVTETLQRLESLLTERGVMIFARIDFSGDAARGGLALRTEQMLIFGNTGPANRSCSVCLRACRSRRSEHAAAHR
jgi:uncharacterized protein (DUF302 family)